MWATRPADALADRLQHGIAALSLNHLEQGDREGLRDELQRDRL